MADKDVFFTPEGLKKIEEEIEFMKTVRRKEVAERIKVALGYGDLSENSEYDEAKNEQAQVEERIAKLENMVRNAHVVEEDELDKDVVNIGSTVKVRILPDDEEETFGIVGSAEADPLRGKISNESPVGSALLGCKVGDVAEVEVPDGIVRYEVLEIHL